MKIGGREKFNLSVAIVVFSVKYQLSQNNKIAVPTVANGDSLDWKDPTPQQICDRVCKNVCPGSIVLFHNAAKNTPAALPSLIERLLSEGYKFVPISENICYKDYNIDHTGRQWPVSASDVN